MVKGKFMQIDPLHFYDEPITPVFDRDFLLEKKQGCPVGFSWRGTDYRIVEMLQEWHDYTRKGRMARNMQPQHAQRASQQGSWGVGRDYYIVKTASGQLFKIYFDRSTRDVDHRKGGWYIWGEMSN